MSSNDSGDEPQVTKPPVARARPARPVTATTVVEPPLDDTAETEQPTVMPPDPLLRAKIAGSPSSRNGNGNGARHGKGSKSNGTSHGEPAQRDKAAEAPVEPGPSAGDEPIEAAAVETTTADGLAGPDLSVGPERAGAVASPATVTAEPETTHQSSVIPTPSPLPPPVLNPPVPDDRTAADVEALPVLEPPIVGVDDTDAATSPRAPSRWSLRSLLAKLTPSAPATDAGFTPAEPDNDAVPGPDVQPQARSSSGPITSPIPVQPPPVTAQASTTVESQPAQSAVRPFVQPVGLMPDQPPYIRPAPRFDPGLFRTGPVPLDPALDPDLPPRRPQTPRLEPVRVAAVRRRGRPRMRRVTRVVRHVDPWSVFKVALCFSLVLYGVCLTAGVLLWNVAYTTGTIDNVQRFFESFGWDTFRFKGGELYHNAWIAGLFCAIGLTGLIVLGATLFNLITDLVGGIRVTVLEEEVIERDPAERRSFFGRSSRHTTSTVANRGRRDDEETIDVYEHLG